MNPAWGRVAQPPPGALPFSPAIHRRAGLGDLVMALETAQGFSTLQQSDRIHPIESL
jgi:hypothetical protein